MFHLSKVNRLREKKLKTHRDLDLWKEGIEFISCIYSVTKNFPKDELYGMTSQFRRAAISITCNISEGAARNHTKEFIRFLRISLGSLSEIESLVYISLSLGYITEDKKKFLLNKIIRLTNQLTGLINSLARNYL